MKGFNKKQFIFAIIAVFVVMQLTDFLIHGVILKSTYEATKDVWRPDMESMMWIMQITGFVFSFFFVSIFVFFAKGHFRKGIFSGFCYGLLIGILINGGGAFNQYVVYDIDLTLVWEWVIFGIIQTIILGIIAAMIYKVEK